MLRPYGLYREHIGRKLKDTSVLSCVFLVLSQHEPTKIMGLPPGVPVASLCFPGTSTKHI